MAEAPASLRVDKWLWQARFFKSRALSAGLVSKGGLRINGVRVAKPAVAVKPGDTLTFDKEGDIRVIRVDAIGTRRGPASEAQSLYTDLDPPKPRERSSVPQSPKFEGKGRPTGRDRRRLQSFEGTGLD